MTVIHILIGMFNSNPMIPQYYWNGQLVWTPALGLYLCVDPRHVERRVT